MATRKNVLELLPENILSARDAAYMQASGYETSQDSLHSVSSYIRMQYPKYPAEKESELDGLLAEGYLLRLSETLRGQPVEYGMVDGNYINVSQLAKKPAERDIITIAYVTGLSNYDYRMLQDNPAKQKVVAEMRDMASTYVSQSKKRLHEKLEKLDNPDKGEKKRSDNKTFRKHWEDLFQAGDKKVKLAIKHGDPDADVAKYNKAVAAFWSVMNVK